MKIFIVRHGDKEKGDYYNKSLRHQDPPLSEMGVQKARNLVGYFKLIQIKRIIASEYARTNQTAQYIAEDKGIQVLIDKRLNEIDNGIIERMDKEEIAEKYPEFWQDYLEGTKDFRFPEGESGEEVKARQIDLLNELIENDEDVLLVSHDGFMRQLMCSLLDIPIYRRRNFKVDLCGIMEFEFDKETKAWRIIKMNQTLT